MAKGKTQTYYDKNPDANRRRLKQQKRYNENGKGREITKAANKLRRKLQIPVGSTQDASHYPGSNTNGRPENKRINRRRPRLKKS